MAPSRRTGTWRRRGVAVIVARVGSTPTPGIRDCAPPFAAGATADPVEAPDPRMSGHDFTLGTGRLACSVHLMRYVVTVAGG